MKCVLSLSHGNAVPERGFSMNKIMLESHGYTIGNNTMAALRLVEDSIRKGGVDKFPITRKLVNYSFKSYAKYQEYLASKRREDERERNLKLQKEAASTAAEARKQEPETIRNEIEKCKPQMKAADEIIADGNRDLGVALESLKKTDRKAVKTAQTKIELGLGQKKAA